MTIVLDRSFLYQFLETAGYGDDDVLAVNFETRKISTRNGGLYQISDAGKIIHLSGPSPDPEDRF